MSEYNDVVKRYVPRECFVRVSSAGVYRFESRGDAVTYIRDLLEAEKGSKPVIAVVGLGGVGKTTVLRKLYLDLLEAGWIPILIRSSFEKEVRAVLLEDRLVIEILVDFADDELKFNTFLSAIYVLAKELKERARGGLTEKEIEDVVELIEKKFNIPIKHEERSRFIGLVKEKVSEIKDVLEIAGFAGVVLSGGFIAPVIGAVFGFQFLEHLIKRGYEVKDLDQLIKKIEREGINKIAILIDDAHELKDLVRRLINELARMELSKVSGKLAIVLSYRIEESGEAFNKIVSGSLKDIFGLEEAKYIATRIQLLYLFPQAKQFREILKANWKDEYNKVCDLESDWELIGKATMWLPKLALITLQTALELGRKVKDLIEELKTEDIDNAGQYALVYEGMSPEEAVNAMKINISYVQSYVRAIYDRLYEKYGPLFTALTLLQGPIAIDILREFLAEYSLSKVEIDERIRMLKRAKGIVVVGREEWVDGERETLSLQDMWREQLQVLEVIESIDRDLKRERDDVAEKLLMIVTNYAKRYDYYTFGMSLNAMCLLRRIYEEYLSTIDKLKVIDIEKLYRVFRATVFWCNLASQYPRMVDEILRLLSDDVKKIFADDKIYESLYKYTIERYGEEEWLKLLIRTIDSIGFLAAVKAASAPSAIDTLIEPYSVLRNLLDIIWNKIKLEIYEKPALVIGYVSAISSLLSLLHYRSHQTPSAIEENLLFTRLQATLEYMFNELKQCKQRTICEELFAITFLEIDPDVLPELLKAIKPLASWAIRFLEGWLEMRDEYPASARLYLKLIGVPPEMWNRYKINRLATLYYALGKYNIDLGALDKAEKLFRRAWWIAWNAAWRLTSTEVINVLISWTWYVRTLFLSYGLKTFNQIIEYPYVKSLSFNIDDRATRKNTIIDAYADIWKWINRTGFIYFMHDFIHDRLLGDIIAVYILCKKRLPIPEEIGFNYENNILNLFRSPMDASLNQGFLIVASNVLNIDIKLDKNEVITKLKNSIEEYKGFMIADIVQIMIYLINGEIDHAINYIKRIEEKLADLQGEILYRLLQNLRLTLERDRKLTENVLEWLTRIYFYLT